MTSKEKICGKCGKPLTRADEDLYALYGEEEIDNEDGTFTWLHLYACTPEEIEREGREDCSGER